MSLHPTPTNHIPDETVRVARAAFPAGNLYMKLRDELGTFYEDADFSKLFPTRGQPCEAPWRLALVTVMQFVEGLSDRQAAEAVRARIDWKYALGLELIDAGFDYSVLCEFRQRLLDGGAEQLLLEKMLERFKARGYLKARTRQRTDSTHVLTAVRTLNRLESVSETLRAALNSLAKAAPEWLRQQVTPEWYERYSLRVEEYRLPKGQAARHAYAITVGTDGFHILRAVEQEKAPVGIKELPAIKTLRQLWSHHYEKRENGQIHWRTGAELPSTSERFDSPYDPQAHYSAKRDIAWIGYKVHLTETCEPDAAHLITHVETTSSVVPDVSMTKPIQAALASKELEPSKHFVESAYVTAELMLSSREQHQIRVVGPVGPDRRWQAHAGEGYDLSHFHVDWEAKSVTCPQGRVSSKWSPSRKAHGGEGINIKFRRKDCRECAVRAKCTRAKVDPRELTLRPQAQHELLQAARQEQSTTQWKKQYDIRAGIEGTLSQGVRAFNLRRSRYVELAKTSLQHVITAAAINVVRIVNWLNEVPLAKTRTSRFAALAASG